MRLNNAGHERYCESENGMKIELLPRARLANLPTPIQELPNLTKKLGGPKIWVKRDDLTGLAFGGNKTIGGFLP